MRKFCDDHPEAKAEIVFAEWFHVVKHANWETFADVRATYNSADRVGHQLVFNVGGNKFRIIAVVNYVAGIVYIRKVLSHEEYERGNWKDDNFGKRGWKPREEKPAASSAAAKRKRRKS